MTRAAERQLGTARIETVNLRKSFRRGDGQFITPVDNVNMHVSDGEMMVLLGPSGCGKTTLLRCIAGLERPDAGTIIINGKIVFCSERRIYVPAERRRISMIFQSYALWPHMTVAENVSYPLRCLKVSERQVGERVGDVLDLVNVGHLSGQYPSRISGGQQQRVALARALVSQSPVILFDEPLSNVDAQVRTQLRFELKRLQGEIGFSAFYVTHDQVEALELGHRVAVMGEGRISAVDTPRAIYETPDNSYVAGFVGAANLWPGQVTSITETAVEVTVGSLNFSARRRDGTDDMFRTGDKVVLVVRPENIVIQRNGGQLGNCFRATLQVKMFSGAYTECMAHSGNLSVRAWARSSDLEGIASSDEVWVHVPDDKIHFVPHERSAVSMTKGP